MLDRMALGKEQLVSFPEPQLLFKLTASLSTTHSNS